MPESQTHISNTLLLTSYCFNILLKAIMRKLESEHPGILKKNVSQVYGFAGYDEQLPSLKSAIYKVSGASVNGKYIYDKKRECNSGTPIIKINKPYNHLLFEYLGYPSVFTFLKNEVVDQTEKAKQLDILNSQVLSESHYYVAYHYGEYKEIVKSQVTVKDNWKRIEYKYVYPQNDGTVKYFSYLGEIKKRADALHINTRTYLDGKMVPSGENILYIGYGDPGKSKYILGVFSAFDIDNKLIAVKTIHEKCSSKKEMEETSLVKKIPGYIAQELRNQRIENEIHIPNDKMEISSKSPYYMTYEKIAGEYTFQFKNEHSQLNDLKIRIDPDTFKMSSMISGILIKHDDIKLIQNASILNLRMQLYGTTPFLQLDIYLKTYYLSNQNGKLKGKYSGIDFENRLLAGEVVFDFKS